MVLRQLAGGFVALALLAGCGGGSDEPEATATAPTDKGGVPVTLSEWAITLPAERFTPGSITVVARNEGAEAHELTVIRTELDAGDLPTTAKDVLVDETELDVVGTTPVFIAGDERTLALDLEPGHYVLICNLPTHYAQGMYTGLSVQE